MRLLLDTHIFIWWTANDPRLRSAHLEAIGSPHNSIYVSAVSAWEIAIKRNLAKLTFTGTVEDAIERHRFEALAVSVRHAEKAGDLSPIHSDPFDRLLVAQAHSEGLTLVTVDQQILRYPVSHI
jgi:PIN domain nuclease of toxin-antitoxin system